MEKLPLNWHGQLTAANAEQVVCLIRQLLTGKSYISVSVNGLYDYTPEVKIDQELRRDDPITLLYGEQDKKHVIITIHDSSGLWQFSTGRDLENPYFIFEEDRFTIRHRAGRGNKLRWTFALQKR